MLKAKVNNQEKEYTIEFENPEMNCGRIDGDKFLLDILKSKEGSFHVLDNKKSYNIEVVSANYEEKQMVLLVNGNKYTVNLRDKYDELLKSLGMDKLMAGKVNELKAPMPGLVLDIFVAPGTAVKKGDPVIVLEAMKMENVLKAAGDGVVKKIAVERKQAVEKNQLLISFE
ncbi:MAG: acetyl-CoA carboxylase biotin carboxyl carrier protein subunit [Bacteroidia bacterium]